MRNEISSTTLFQGRIAMRMDSHAGNRRKGMHIISGMT
ncbi:hypothetical protein [Enterobacter hormaechei]|nr:hypothetical protein [Enterobacter hormaechei]